MEKEKILHGLAALAFYAKNIKLSEQKLTMLLREKASWEQ